MDPGLLSDDDDQVSVATTEPLSDWIIKAAMANQNPDTAKVAADFEMRCAAVKVSKS